MSPRSRREKLRKKLLHVDGRARPLTLSGRCAGLLAQSGEAPALSSLARIPSGRGSAFLLASAAWTAEAAFTHFVLGQRSHRGSESRPPHSYTAPLAVKP